MMCVPRLGRMTGTSASSWSSSGRSRSAHTPVALTTLAARTSNASPALGVAHARAERAAALLEQPGRLDAVGGDRAEALGLGEHGQHEPHVVGLAVVEEVAAARARARPARAAARRPRRRRSRGGAPGSSPRPVAVAVARGGARAARRSRSTAITSYMFSPSPTQAVGPRAVEGGHDQRQRPDEVRRQRDVDLALQQRLAHQPEVEVLQVAQAAVDELARARRGARSRSRPARPARPSSRAWRRRARRRRR